jgi:hypothetical protein
MKPVHSRAPFSATLSLAPVLASPGPCAFRIALNTERFQLLEVDGPHLRLNPEAACRPQLTDRGEVQGPIPRSGCCRRTGQRARGGPIPAPPIDILIEKEAMDGRSTTSGVARHRSPCMATKSILMSLLAVFLAAGAASAQSPGAIFLEGMLGGGAGLTNGEHSDGYRSFAGALLGFRHGSFVVGAGAAIQPAGNYDLVCVVRPDGSCVPRPDNAGELAMLVGREVADGSVRLLAGLTYATVGTLGAQLRVDAFLPVDGRVTPMAGLQYSALPGFNDGTLHLLKLGVGLRIR